MSADGKDQRPEVAELALKTAKPSASGRRKSARSSMRFNRKSAATCRPIGRQASQSAYGPAFKFAGELLVGVVVGGGLGWALDKQFGTAPWLMVLLVILGFAAGLLNVVRAAQQAQAKNEPLQRAAPSVKDDDGE